jgi:putative heme-binding domain-containing protein
MLSHCRLLRFSTRAWALTAVACVIALAGRDAAGEAAGKLRLPPGFRSELVYAVPLETQGSWVSLCTDDRGRIIAGDEKGALYRVTPSPVGGDSKQTKVERLMISIGMAQGLLYHRGHLYVMQNGRVGSFGAGLYRVSDSDGDDRFDTVRQIRVFEGEGEHGPHAILPSPDGNQLYICCGNFTKLPLFSRSLPPPRWQEDQLLPRIGDPRGHANDIKAPGGWIARMDLDGNNLEIVSVGYRNMYDIAMNGDGELFTYDSDMEWDIGTPWYRPTRVCHVTSGSDFGWRGGNGVWPAYFIDTLPTVAESGPGSPTGLTFGAGTKFPPKYQRALFGGDWSYGNIYVFHIQPEGSSYRGEVERFASAMPLGVTDMIVRKEDGALYFAVGGRNSESALYRIFWNGEDAGTVASSDQVVASTSPSEARELRHSLEKLHAAAPSEKVVKQAWPHLANPDRFISTAARIAIEHQPFKSWQTLALQEENVDARLTALVAYARMADRSEQTPWVNALARSRLEELSHEQRLNLLRAASLGVIRFDPLEPPVRQKLLAAFDASFPTGNGAVDRELSHLLVRLRVENVIPRLLDVMENSPTQEEAIDAAMTLSCVTEGWTIDQRTRLLNWFDKSSRMAGGMSFFGYLVAARDRFIVSMPTADHAHFAQRLSRPFAEQPAQIEAEVRPFVREWTLDEVDQLVQNDPGPRSFENGRKMFAAAGCYNCHRVAGAGSSIGPDLTGVGGRFGARDLLRSVIEPDHTISDQYQQMVFETNGRIVVGRVTNIQGDLIHISTNMLDPKSTVTIERDELDDQHPSEVSVMPAGLFNTLSAEEILDLTAFLRSGGRPDHELFSTGGGQ